MPKRLSSVSKIDDFRADARRWLKALQAGDRTAKERLKAAWAQSPTPPTLRSVQHALAREYDFANWAALRAALEDLAGERRSRAERHEEVLRSAWGGDVAAAKRILAKDPEIGRMSLHAAAMTGDLAEAKRRLTADPGAARVRAGPRDAEPLIYLAYGRLSDGGLDEAMAALLLDHGADPKAEFDDGWGNPFTVLTGVIGEGEGDRAPHPRAEALAEQLIDRGVDPFDTQALYNTSITRDDVRWLERLYRHCVRQGSEGRWREQARGLGGRLQMPALDYLLGNAVANGHLERARWLLDHGADTNALHAYSGRPLQAEAQLRGHPAVADLLAARGAASVALSGHDALLAAVARGDEDAAVGLAAADRSLLRAPDVLMTAAGAGRTALLGRLLDLGADANAVDGDGVSVLHNAAMSGRVDTVQLLIDRGAAIDPMERRFNATPLGWATHFGLTGVVAQLAAVSRHVPSLAFSGAAERLEVVLAETPGVANSPFGEVGRTPLYRLPDDPDAAASIAESLLKAGADPKHKDGEGVTPAQAARRRGLDDAADLIDGWRI